MNPSLAHLVRLQFAREWWMRTGGLTFAPITEHRTRTGWQPPEQEPEEKAA